MSVFDLARSAALRIRVVWPLLVFVLLDATFNLYFWRIPKLTRHWVDYGYQFLFDAHQIPSEKRSGAKRVIAFGSSVAQSFDAEQVQSLLQAEDPGLDVHVWRFLLPGIKPSDYRLLFEAERDVLQPDVVVLPLNLGDFLNPSVERGVKPQLRYVLPPWRTLWERYGELENLSARLDLALAGMSNLYRHRQLIRSCVQDHAKFAARWLQSQDGGRTYGVFADGYTSRHFALAIGDVAAFDFQYYVHPKWIEQRGRVRVIVTASREKLADRIETDAGWKTVHLVMPAGHDGILEVATDSGWSPRAAGLSDDMRLLGVKLREVPAGSSNGAMAPLRYPPIADRPKLLRMGGTRGAEFLARWERMLNADTDFGRAMRGHRDAKLAIRSHVFRPRGEYVQMERLVAEFAARGTAVVLVNSPESALLRTQYENAPYYQGQLAFLRDLAERYPGVYFYDLATLLPAEDFNDWHHISYVGAIKLGPKYAAFIRQALTKPAEPVLPSPGGGR